MDGIKLFVFGILAGVIITLGVLIVVKMEPSKAYAEAAGGTGGMFAITGSQTASSNANDMLWLLDPGSKRLCAYKFSNGTIVFTAIRQFEFDLQIEGDKNSSDLSKYQSVFELKKALDKLKEPKKTEGK
jgi:hypothetical protein